MFALRQYPAVVRNNAHFMFNIIAIVISFTGSIILAFSVQENPHAYQELKNGGKKHFAIIDAKLFKTGVWLIVLGFATQIIIALCDL